MANILPYGMHPNWAPAYHGAVSAYKYFRGRKRSYPVRSKRRGRKIDTFNQRVKKIVNNQKETKFINVAINDSTPISGTSVVTPLSLVATGDGDEARDGHEILLNSVQCRILVVQDTTPASATVTRLFLIRAFKNIDGILPVMGDFLMTDSVDSLRQIDNRGDFQVLANLDAVMEPPTVAGNQGSFWYKYYKKFSKPIRCQFDAESGAVSSAEKGHLFLVRMCNLASGSQPAWFGSVRVTFKDI